jgi:hypothetical protein
MDSDDLAKTLEVLKAISDLELAIAELYHDCSKIREAEKDFWAFLEQDEQKHARKIQEIAQMISGQQFLCVPNRSFNLAAVSNLKNFVKRNHKKLQKLEIPRDFKNLLSIAWNIEYSLAEIKYNDLFSIAEQDCETILQTVLSETAAHRSKIGSKITVMRNLPSRSHSRLTPNANITAQKKFVQKTNPFKLN